MEIRIRTSGEVMTEDAFRGRFISNVIPTPLNGKWLNEFGADVVLNGPEATPADPRYQYSYRDGVELLNGQWFTKFSVGPVFKTEEEMTAYKEAKDVERAAQVRSQRNALLKDTDGTQTKDAPEALSAKFAPYRQELRDVPAQAGFPYEVIWPTQPE